MKLCLKAKLRGIHMKHKIISSVFVVLLSFFAAAAIAALGAAVCLKMPDPASGILPFAIFAFAASSASCGYLAGKNSRGSAPRAAIICLSYFSILTIASIITGTAECCLPQLSISVRLLTVLGAVVICFIGVLIGENKKSHGKNRATKRKNSIAAKMKSRRA